jgi:hypothetical protein
MADRRLRQILARWRAGNPATTNRIISANAACNSTTSHAKAELKAPLDIEGSDFRKSPASRRRDLNARLYAAFTEAVT